MKKIIVGILLLCLLFGFQNVFAEEGTCGINVKYTIEGNTITYSKGSQDQDPYLYARCSLTTIFRENEDVIDASLSDITIIRVDPGVGIWDNHMVFDGLTYVEEMYLANLDVSGFTDMSSMFEGCSSLVSLDLSGWNTSNVESMSEMFKGCSSLVSLDLSGWDTSKVKNMDWMFEGCSSLVSLDLSGWDFSNVEDMNWMFEGCSSLVSLDLSGWDTSKVKSMYEMFEGCSSLVSLDLSGWNTSNVESMKRMFNGCDSLNTLVLGQNTLNNNIFSTLPTYYNKWSYDVQGADASNPLPLNTVKTNGSLFTEYDFDTMAGTWIVKDLRIILRDFQGSDVTETIVPISEKDYQLNAVAIPATATQEFIWESSDPTIAEVDSTGMVTFNQAGKVSITATANDGSAVNASVTLIYGILPTAVVFTDANGNDISGKTITINTPVFEFHNYIEPEDALQEIGGDVSGDTDIVSFEGTPDSPILLFSEPGTVTLTSYSLEYPDISSSVTIIYQPQPLAASVTIKNSGGTAVSGKTVKTAAKTYQLTASAEPAAASQKFTWKSSNTAIAAVDASGKVTFKKAGTVKITATASDGSGKSASVTVTTDIKATSVTIKNSAGTAVNGKTVKTTAVTYQLTASAAPAGFAAQKFTWKSSNTAIATVDAAGKVTFKKAGTVTITATASDGSNKSATVKLTTDIKATKVIIKNPAGKAITGKKVTIKTKTYTLKAAANPLKFAAQKFTWKSSNKNIATVKAGKVTFKKVGTVTITVTASDGSKKTGKVTLTYKP